MGTRATDRHKLLQTESHERCARPLPIRQKTKLLSTALFPTPGRLWSSRPLKEQAFLRNHAGWAVRKSGGAEMARCLKWEGEQNLDWIAAFAIRPSTLRTRPSNVGARRAPLRPTRIGRPILQAKTQVVKCPAGL